MSSGSPWQSPALLCQEILLQIFAATNRETNFPRLKQSLWISHVCQYWRRSVLSDPSIWSNIDFKHKKLASLALRRTAWDTPLHIGLSDVRAPSEDPEVYNFIRDNWSRIRSLTIDPADPDENFPSIFQFFVDNPPPKDTLQELYIFGDCYYPDESDSEYETPPPPPLDRKPVLNLLAWIESLRSVDRLALHSIEIPTWSPLYDNLVELDLYDHRPLIPVHQILDVLRRSPRLQVIRLDTVHDDVLEDTIVQSPCVELLELWDLHIQSRTFRGTAFLLGHIHAPNITNLYILAKSNNFGAEYSQLLAPFRNSNLTLPVTEIWLHGTYDEGTDFRTDDSRGENPHSLSIRIENTSWGGQLGSSSFLQYFPNVRKVHLDCDSAKASNLFRAHNIEELVLGGRIDTQAFYEMSSGGSLDRVRTLQFNCESFSSCSEAGFLALSRAKSLRLLRLIGHAYLSDKDIRSFMEFGVKHRIWIQWVKNDKNHPELHFGRPPRKDRPVIEYYNLFRMRRSNTTEGDVGVGKLAAGQKRALQEDTEDEDFTAEGGELPKKYMFHFPVDFWRNGFLNTIDDPLLARHGYRRNREFEDLMNLTWEDVMGEFENKEDVYGGDGDRNRTERGEDGSADMDVD